MVFDDKCNKLIKRNDNYNNIIITLELRNFKNTINFVVEKYCRVSEKKIFLLNWILDQSLCILHL